MSDFAMKHAMKKRMAKGSMGCADCAAGSCMAHGGEVKDAGSGFSDDMVERIMKHRYAKGGEVEPLVDSESNDFDVMDKSPAEEFSYTGENSGDELGNAALDDDDEDVVSKIMKSRSKKDRMPRPA